jgi:hypothetical protein
VTLLIRLLAVIPLLFDYPGPGSCHYEFEAPK